MHGRALAGSLILALNLGVTRPAAAEGGACVHFDHSHPGWNGLLATFVQIGKVDYQRWAQTGRTGLQEYLRALEGVCARDYDGWSRAQKLAYWINAYNAYTVELIMRHYPLDSIRDIGLRPGAAWREDFIPITVTGEKRLSLNDVEHEIIRKQFDEPRIHFALVCAAKSCPPLRDEAYVATRLDAQLGSQARGFLGDRTRNRYDAKSNTLHLSRIFDWYGGDFEKAGGSVARWVSTYIEVGNPTSAKVEYLDYDWALNGK